MKELRFGIALSTSAAPGADVACDARHIEELGFDLLTVSDHLHGTHPTVETWTALTWAAAATERIRLAPTVLGLPYRPLAVVAKMAESLHRLSGGRLILGLGGGGSDQEFEAFGLGRRSARDKVDGLAEAIEVIRGLWTNETFTYGGRIHQVHDAHLEPKPETPIPIWTGSYGPRSLEVTGRLADGWNPSMAYLPPDDAARARDRVRQAADNAGRDPDDVTCSYNVAVYVDERGESDPRIVAGPPERVAERLTSLVRLGFTTLIFWARGGRDGRERLARDVLPLVRACAHPA